MKLKKISLLIVTAMILVLSGCGLFGMGPTERVKKELKDKYGCEFTPVTVGDRWLTNHAKYECYPNYDPEIIFTATYDTNTKEVSDDFTRRMIGRQIEKRLEEGFSEYGLKITCQAQTKNEDSTAETSLTMTLQEYLDKYEVDYFWIHILIDSNSIDSNTAHNIREVFLELNKDYPMKQVCGCYVLETKTYEEKKVLMENASWFNNINEFEEGVVNIFTINSENGEFWNTEEETQSYLEGKAQFE